MVPKGWEKITLEQVSTVVTSGSRDWAKYYAESGSLFIRMTNLRRDSIFLKLDDLKYVNVKSESSDGKRTKLVAGDILISITAELGKIGYVPENLGSAYINQHTALIRIDESKADNKFIAYLLSSAKLNRAINKLNDSGAKAGLNLPAVRSILLEIPLKPEQTQITNILTTWDRAITQTEKLIEAKRKLKKGLMQPLLTGKLRLPGFREPWLKKKLGEIFCERREINYPELLLLSITGGRGVIPHSETDRRDSSAEDKSKYKRIAPGDIGYNTMRMWQGVSALSRMEGIVSPAYTICVPKPDIDGSFAAYLFKFPPVVYLFYRYSQGLVDDTLNLKFPHFAQITIDLPPLSEQNKIAAVLGSLDREIESLVALSERIKEQKRGLMQKLLTGQIRVKATEEITAS